MSCIFVLLWHFRMPIGYSPIPLDSALFSYYNPEWVVNEVSWLFSIAIVVLTTSFTFVSMINESVPPGIWFRAIFVAFIGLASVTANNLFTVLLAWAAFDIFNLIDELILVTWDNKIRVTVNFSLRIVGIGLALWVTSSDYSSRSGFYIDSTWGILALLLAIIIRIGVLSQPSLPNKEASFPRGYRSFVQLVSAISCIFLIGYLPITLLDPKLLIFLLILSSLTSAYLGIRWLVSSSEVAGHPYWISGIGFLVISSALNRNPTGSIGLGMALIIAGGMIFLYTARHRGLAWLPSLAVFILSALPMSITGSVWNSQLSNFVLYWLMNIPGIVLFVTGIIKHGLQPGDKAFESIPSWGKLLYLSGMGLMCLVGITLGIWGWEGSFAYKTWWASLPVIPLGCLIFFYFMRGGKGKLPVRKFALNRIAQPAYFSNLAWDTYRFVRKIIHAISSQLEGDSGILWSLVLLVLILSLLIRGGI